MRKLQIGVMGSAADLKYSKKVEKTAERLGELVAEAGFTFYCCMPWS
jgi:predicted Rossmann-fold nucleotide-binding protein